MTEKEMLALYRTPEGPVDVVLDTDTYNEIDDQFALAYLLKYEAKLKVIGLTVAPFENQKMVLDIPEGLVKSREEIQKILKLSGKSQLCDRIFDGSDRFLKDEQTPVESSAARFLVEASRQYSPARPLYVLGIGAITNIASALLLDPSIVDRICVIWLGGSSLGWWINQEYNMFQDYAGVRTVMKSGVPFVQIPAHGVVSEFCTTKYELKHWLEGRNALADYLYETCVRLAESQSPHRAWSRVIWDVAAPAWLLNEDNRFLLGRIENRYLPAYEGWRYEEEPLGIKMFYVHQINRDALMSDLFEKLSGE